MKKLLFILLLASSSWAQTACPTNGWCVIFNSAVAPLTHFDNNMWNSLTYAQDANLTFLFMNGGGALTPESNGVFAYSAQCTTAASGCNGTGTMASPKLANGVNPWQGVSQCGDDGGSNTLVNRQGMQLAESITATTGTCSSGCTAADYIHLTGPAGKNIPSGTGPLNPGNTINGSGVVWIGNEAVRYGRCTSTPSFTGGTCSTTSGPDMYLWGTNDGTSAGTQAALIRGTRQTAGYSAPVAHAGLCPNGGWPCTQSYGEAAGWDCYAPQLGNFVPNTPAWQGSPTNTAFTDVAVSRAGSWSHPSDRHYASQSLVYDSKRGRLWAPFGWQEAWQQQDTWSLCVVNKGGAGGGDELSICGANDLYSSPSTTKGWQRVPWPGTNPATPLYTWVNSLNPAANGSQNSGVLEEPAIYDPQNDVIVNVGGLAAGSSRHEVLIFCMSATSTGYGCTSGNVGTWQEFKPTTSLANCSASLGFYCGDAGPRDGSRMAIDPVSHRIMVFGGAINNTWYSNTIAVFDAHTGDVCISSNADASEPTPPSSSPRTLSWCPLTTVSGTPPPEKTGTGAWNINLKFPDWTYDSGLGKFVFYGGDGSGANAQVVNGVSEAVNDSSIAGIWFWNPSTNAWSQPALSATSGPQIPQLVGHNSITYDSIDGVIEWLSGNGTASESMWQVPDTALGGSAPTTFTLTLTIAGTGSGTATDSNSGFSCGSGTCTHTYTSGSIVSLSASGTNNSVFAGWSGDCSGTNICVLTMSANHSVTATFNAAVRTVQDTTYRSGGTYKQ